MPQNALTLTPLQGIPLVQPGDDLAQITLAALSEADLSLRDQDILVYAQKVISKSEGRLVNLASVEPSLEAVDLASKAEKDPRLVELIMRESSEILRIRPGLIIVEHHLGFICANAGIDHSNVSPPGTNEYLQKVKDDNDPDDWVLLLPSNPDASATIIRQRIEAEAEVRLGVLIIDSHGRAWRSGTQGVTIGISGIPGVMDMRGEMDLFGYQLRVTEIATADELAAAASLVMGGAAEGIPIIHVRGFPYTLRDSNLMELLRPKEKDLFR